MGFNCLRGVALKGSRRRVKIMKVDGTVMKLWSPVHVKEILGYHADHQIFEADPTNRLSMHNRPLSQSTELRPGQLYFLIPLPTPPILSSTTSPDRPPEIYHKAFSDRDLIREESDDIKSRIISSTDKGTTVRLTIRLTKEQAASLLSIDRNNVMEDLVTPLIQQAMRNKQQQSWDSIRRRWKPSLETISEHLSPSLHNS